MSAQAQNYLAVFIFFGLMAGMIYGSALLNG